MINYTIYKNDFSADWVTFVHGAGGSSSVWFKQIREFQKYFNVLLLDLRGHGSSKSPIKNAIKQKYTFSAIANDIVEVMKFQQNEIFQFLSIQLPQQYHWLLLKKYIFV